MYCPKCGQPIQQRKNDDRTIETLRLIRCNIRSEETALQSLREIAPDDARAEVYQLLAQLAHKEVRSLLDRLINNSLWREE